MKKLFTVYAAVLLAVSAAAFAACAPRTPATVTLGENAVLITPSSEVLGITAETTLADYMDELVSRNELEYQAADGMITSINGKAQEGSSYWMLYTDDAENSNADWGTAEYEGKTYLSATLGYGLLPIKEGCTYIWLYQTF